MDNAKTLDDCLAAKDYRTIACRMLLYDSIFDYVVDALEWRGLDWQAEDRSTGAFAGYAGAEPVEEWMQEVLNWLPHGIVKNLKDEAAERLTEDRLWNR